MKTKSIFTLLALLTISVSQAQLLDKLKKKAEKAAERTIEKRVERETEKKTDKTLDEIFEEKSTQKDKKSSKKESKENNSSTKPNQEMVTGSSFFPDGRIVFQDDFKQDAQGDFPGNWETNSGGEIIMVDKTKALRLYPNGNYITKTGKLPENYALEFDLITDNLDYQGLSGSQFGLHFSNEKNINRPKSGGKFAFSLWKGSTTCNQLLVENWGKVTAKINNKIPFKVQNKLNTTTHFTMVVNGSRLRVYIDNEKTIDLPSFLTNDLGNYIQFYLKGTDTNEKHVVAINNLKITEEGEDIRSKILKGGFSTNQILFDSGSDKIKTESFSYLDKIGKVLNEDKSISLKIIGHTDSDGDSKANLTLSQKRAISVKKYLQEKFKISDALIQTDGKGENEPVTDNKTSEGKAQNRRVEFKKIAP